MKIPYALQWLLVAAVVALGVLAPLGLLVAGVRS